MNSSFTSSQTSKQTFAKGQNSPQKQQWALINQYKALEYQKMKQKQRMLAQQKKNNFRRQLDNQLNSKNNVYQQQKQLDRRYYEFITKQANQQKQREERERLEKIIKRRQAEEENARLLQISRNSRMRDHDTGYHLEIGHKSEQDRRINTENIKKTVLDTLDQQIRQKNEEKQQAFWRQRQNQMKNLQYQYEFFDKRSGYHKNFGQNQKVYQYYEELDRQKRIKDMDLDHRFVDEAAFKKRMSEDQKIRNEQFKKYKIQEQVKQALDQQVKQHSYKKFQQSKINPEQYSYGVISNIFRQRPSSFDRAKYVQELKMQAEEQKRKKKMENFMSEQEYRLNMNQLNKVVNGEYAHNGYIDRSMGTIGDSKLLKLGDIKDKIPHKDAENVKQRLDLLRKNNNTQMLDRSF